MKGIRKLLRRVKQTFAPRQGKRGSSLAFVMMVGAALVIWVLCIMPLMANTGTAAYKTQGNYDDYILSRSAIEFCKSELEKIVEEEIPYTFAVTGDADSGFQAIAKWNETNITVRGEYSSLVTSPDPLDDRKDYPTSNSVVAICAVEPNHSDPNIYDIVMTTYHNCEKGLIYSATFTPRGSLLIHPEAYRQEQALPLSDFVVVDGKIGANTVWDSTINMNNAESLGFTETLLPWIAPTSSEWHAGYANTGEYPAVFKTTANAASDGDVNISDPVTMGDLSSDENWIMPTAGNNAKAGNIWYEISDGVIRIYMYTSEKVEITNDCTVYLNGRASYDRAVPKTGIYTVSVDYQGTDYSTDEHLDKYDDTKVNVLPISGLHLNNNINKITTGKHTIPETSSVEDIEKVEVKNASGQIISTTYTVTLKDPADDLVYGYIDADKPTEVHWSASNVITGLDGTAGKTYFFYICRPASYEDGVFKADSDVKSAGMIFVPKFATKLNSGTKYAIVGQAQNTYYLLNSGAKVDAFSPDSDFLTSNISAYGWTAKDNNGNWSFQNGNYLNIVCTPTPHYTENKVTHRTWYDWIGHSCIKRSCDSCSWAYAVSVGDSRTFAVSSSGSDFKLSYAASHTEKYKEYDCDDYNTASATFNTTAYLNLNGSVSASDKESTVKFMQLPPAAPTTPKGPSGDYSIGNTVVFGTNVLAYVNGYMNSAELVSLYANGQEVTGLLNAGVYHMVAKIKVDELECYANLGTLTVTKADLDASEITVNAARTAEDELRIDISASGWHANGGLRYYGYKTSDETDYHWYTTNDVSYSFRLKYGTYQFAVRESGTNNYKGIEVAYDGTITLASQYVSADKININDFIYTFDKNTGEYVWYRLPEGIIPSRVTLVYGYYWEGWTLRGYKQSLHWDDEYHGDTHRYLVKGTSLTNEDHEHLYYGVIIEGTDYKDLEHVFQISSPVGINTVNGHTSSMMRGSSLYFMARNGSIDTYGTDIYLTTDLLVLNSDIIGGGKVIVTPYNTSGVAGDTLLFVANRSGIVRNSTTIFEGRKFYRIPSGTDLCAVSAVDASNWMVRGDNPSQDVVGTTRDSQVKYLFRQGVYPEINLDIAYATNEQLSRIINSETIGWTEQGVLSGNSSSTNPGYAITTYVTSMNGATSYKANRILIAANTGTSKTLDVTSDLTLTTRYLSVDADQIVGNGTKFKLNNLAQDQNFLVSLINSITGLSNYSSKSLQMDYERNTMIISNGATTQIASQICRYDHGTDLLGGATNMALMAEYTTSEIENLFKSGIFGDSWLGGLLGSTVKTVDRYVSLKADNDDGAINVSSRFTGNQLDIYANYVYIDSSVKEINLTSRSGSNDIRISSQESGYTTFEYLGIFKGHSAETYTGTILYFSGTVTINCGSGPKQVAPGFYWINATDKGTSLSVLADNPADYRIDPAELKDFSVYINPDGSLSNAYVDTGLLDDSSVGAGGFSGGNMG